MRFKGVWGLVFAILATNLPVSLVSADNNNFQVSGVILDDITPRLNIAASSNDPFFSRQRELNQASIVRAWDITTGSNIPVAVIDTGIFANHEDLVGRLWVNSDEVPGNNRDDDANGYVDDYNGYNFVDNNADIADSHGHGTGISSIIAANTNNGKGMAGIDWSAKIMVLKALDNAGGGEFGNVIDAIRYAANNGARVINMSFGSPSDDPSLASAISYAVSKNVVVIAASGNAGVNNVYYPAAYSEVIAVGSVNSSSQLSSFSNYGSTLDLVAPGENIVVATSSGTFYAEAAGSSFASAMVTGVAALLLAKRPNLKPSEVDNILKATAQKIEPVPSPRYGYGLVNAYAAVTQPASNYRLQSSASATQVAATGTDIITVTATLLDDTNQPGANIPVSLKVSGTNNIVNGQLLSLNGVQPLGSTNASGQITFQLASNIVENKQATLTAQTTGLATSVVDLKFVAPAKSTYSMSWLAQSPYPTLPPSGKIAMWVEVKNTGNIAWVADPNNTNGRSQMKLGTDRPLDRVSKFADSSWLSSNRAVLMTPAVVKPNETARFSFQITAPASSGKSREYFRPVNEYVTWLNDLGIYWDITVGSGISDSPSTAASEYGAALISKSGNITLAPGASGTLSLTIKNTGITPWWPTGPTSGAGIVKLGTSGPRDRISKFSNLDWLSNNRAVKVDAKVLPDNQIVLQIPIKAPAERGTYTEKFQLVSELVTWFGPEFAWTITVQ